MVVVDGTSPQAPAGHALLICLPPSLESMRKQMGALGYEVSGADNPYSAFVELLDRPLVYRSVVVSLAAVYREELTFIKAIRGRLPHVDVLLAHTDGRAAAMAEAMRLGATGILDEDAVHRLGDIAPPPGALSGHPSAERPVPASDDGELTPDESTPEEEGNDLEPILTADELRALLQEQPTPGHP
jgi:hypothetical protein